MPWWFWVISHIWVMCSAGLFVGFVVSEEFDDTIIVRVLLGFLSLIAPITLIVACIAAWLDHNWEDKLKLKDRWFFKEMKKLKDRWLIRKLKQVITYCVKYKARRKDFKEIEDNEDEWSAERLGIKLK